MSWWPESSSAATDGGDLAVHHPGRGDDGRARVGLGDRHPPVQLDGRVVVDLAPRREDAAVAVVGVLVEAQVGDEHDVVAHLRDEVAQRDLHDAVGVPRLRALGVLRGRHAEEDDARDAQRGQLGDLLAQRLAGVLHDAGQRGDGLRLGDPLAHEQRGDEVVDGHPRLGDQPPQRGRPAQSPQPFHSILGGCAPGPHRRPATWRSHGRPMRSRRSLMALRVGRAGRERSVRRGRPWPRRPPT